MNHKQVIHQGVGMEPLIYLTIWFEVITRKRFGLNYIWKFNGFVKFLPAMAVIVIWQGTWPITKNYCMFTFGLLCSLRLIWNLYHSYKNRLNEEESYIHTMNTGQPLLDSEFFNHLLIRRWIEPMLWFLIGLAISTWTDETEFGSFVYGMALVYFIKEQRLRRAHDKTYQTLADESYSANSAENQVEKLDKSSKDLGEFFDVEE